MKTIKCPRSGESIEIKAVNLDDCYYDTPVKAGWPLKDETIRTKVRIWRYMDGTYKCAFALLPDRKILYIEKNVNYPDSILSEIIAYENF